MRQQKKQLKISKHRRTSRIIYRIVKRYGLIFVLMVFIVIGSEMLLPKLEATPTVVIANTPPPPPFNPPALIGKAAYVYDLKNDRAIYDYNGETPLPLASITKLMTALIVKQNLSDGDVVTVDQRAILEDTDNNGLVEGEEWKAKDLLNFSLIVSSNVGIYALSEAVTEKRNDGISFEDLMNAEAQKIGLTQTHYDNPDGLDISTTEPGAVGSAHDMATLMEYILKNYPNLLEATQYDEYGFKSLDGVVHKAENTDLSVDKIQNIIASKTGYTDLAGGNLIIAYDAGFERPIISVVLGSTEEGRFTDTESLASSTLRYIAL